MQVCHITSVHPRYDIRIFIKECQALTADHQVSLIVADSLGDELKDGVQIYDVGRVTGGRLSRMRIGAKRVLNKVLEIKPEVVHFHDPELLGIGVKLAKLGYKVIYDVHEDVPKQVMNKHWIPRGLRPLISKLVEFKERNSAAKFSGVVCATEIIAARFKQYNSNTIAIHNFPILAELMQQDVAWNDRQDSICYIGSISATRGIIPLVDSLALSGARLELAGSYSGDTIAQQIKNSAGAKLVNYHGVINRQQIGELLAQVKVGMVTLLPTPSYLESLPIKLFEYMLAGIPVVASNFPLWYSIVEGNDCGLMVDPSDASAIANACQWLLNNQDEAEKMGHNGRAAVLKHYTWDAELHKFRNFYNELP